MAVRFSEEQVISITNGRALQAGARSSYSSVSTDTRTLSEGALFVALPGERYDAHQFLDQAFARGAQGAVVQKGKPLPPVPPSVGLFEVTDTLAALGQLAHFHRQRFKIPVGAVTGSNGKTTTKEMVASILSLRGPALKTEGNFNNEVGLPLTLFNLSPQHVAAVVEMGMNRPGEIARLTQIAQPDAGLVTVVHAAHLSGLGSLAEIAAAKGELFAGLSKQATAVVNLDDPLVMVQASRTGARKLTFGKVSAADVWLKSSRPRGKAGLEVVVVCDGQELAIPMAFIGEHNAVNAAAAFALALAMGYSPGQCAEGLSRAKPEKRRLNLLSSPAGYSVLDDCYNANPASMKAALETLKTLSQGNRAVAVLGDMLELGPEEEKAHRELGEWAGALAQRAAFFGPRSKVALEASGLGEAGAHFTEMEPLLHWLLPQLQPGDLILVKGSRGMKLERAVDALLQRSASEGDH